MSRGLLLHHQDRYFRASLWQPSMIQERHKSIHCFPKIRTLLCTQAQNIIISTNGVCLVKHIFYIMLSRVIRTAAIKQIIILNM